MAHLKKCKLKSGGSTKSCQFNHTTFRQFYNLVSLSLQRYQTSPYVYYPYFAEVYFFCSYIFIVKTRIFYIKNCFQVRNRIPLCKEAFPNVYEKVSRDGRRGKFDPASDKQTMIYSRKSRKSREIFKKKDISSSIFNIF